MVKSVKILFLENENPSVNEMIFCQDKRNNEIRLSYLSNMSHNDVPKDIYLVGYMIPNNFDFWGMDHNYHLKEVNNSNINDLYRIIATTNRNLFLPNIPVDFINEFINSNGNISKAKVLWEEQPGEFLTELDNMPYSPAISRPIINGYNTIIVNPPA